MTSDVTLRDISWCCASLRVHHLHSSKCPRKFANDANRNKTRCYFKLKLYLIAASPVRRVFDRVRSTRPPNASLCFSSGPSH